jgi:hypothetical protein
LESVVCLINEAKDFGDDDRFAFYERMKPWLGGTATDVLMCADKWVRAHPVYDVFDPIITTNFKVRGLYLPPEDARHYFAWSDRQWTDWGYPDFDTLNAKYFAPIYDWYVNGGYEQVAHYLMNVDLSDFSPTAPPPKTPAWHEVVAAYENPSQGTLASILEMLGDPPAVSVREVMAADHSDKLHWMAAKSRNTIPGDFEDVGFVHQRNLDTNTGRWAVGPKNKRREVQIYVRANLPSGERWKAALDVFKREQAHAAEPTAKAAEQEAVDFGEG